MGGLLKTMLQTVRCGLANATKTITKHMYHSDVHATRLIDVDDMMGAGP